MFGIVRCGCYVSLVGRRRTLPYVGGHGASQSAADRDSEHAVVRTPMNSLCVSAKTAVHQEPLLRMLPHDPLQHLVDPPCVPVDQLVQLPSGPLYEDRLVADDGVAQEALPYRIDRDDGRPGLHGYGDDALGRGHFQAEKLHPDRFRPLLPLVAEESDHPLFLEEPHDIAGRFFVGDDRESCRGPQAIEKSIEPRVSFQRPGEGNDLTPQEMGGNAHYFPIGVMKSQGEGASVFREGLLHPSPHLQTEPIGQVRFL